VHASASPVTSPKPAQQTPVVQRALTAREIAEREKYMARMEEAPSVRMKASTDETKLLQIDYHDEQTGVALLMNATGTTDRDFLSGLLHQIVQITSGGGYVHEGKLNFVLSIIRDAKPRNQLQAMLASQAAVLHLAFMKIGRSIAWCGKVPQHDSVALIKLSRTFAMLLETLQRSQTGGPLTLQQNVSVSDGGQAIVANVTQPASETTPRMADESRPTGGLNNGSSPTDSGREHLGAVPGAQVVQPADDVGDRGLANAKTRPARVRWHQRQ
jgi:hypothetical protein